MPDEGPEIVPPIYDMEPEAPVPAGDEVITPPPGDGPNYPTPGDIPPGEDEG